jgi:hypothetical protein
METIYQPSRSGFAVKYQKNQIARPDIAQGSSADLAEVFFTLLYKQARPDQACVVLGDLPTFVL